MKRRNAEPGKMRRPVKRNKPIEGTYGNSMLYLKFIMFWATVVMADYMLEFRFEFLYPFWMMIKSVYDSFKCHGVAFSVFFICIVLTSDMICFFFIPLQYVFFAASSYVWVQYVWSTFADKGICLPTVALCCLVVYTEGAVRARTGPLELWRPLAANCVGYHVITLGFDFKAYVGQRLKIRRQKQVRAENEFYFQLLREAVPESALAQNAQKEESKEYTQTHTQPQAQAHATENGAAPDTRHMNGSVKRRCARDHNGVCVADYPIQLDKDKVEKEKNSTRGVSSQSTVGANSHAYSNGAVSGPGAPEHEERHEVKGGKTAKFEKKEASTLREDKKKQRNRDKDKDKDTSDSYKSVEQTKESLAKEVENVKNSKDSNSHKEKREEKDKENKERDKEREQKEKEMRSCRELLEELRRVRVELSSARSGEAEARRALAAAASSRRDHSRASVLHHSERAALERRLSEERRARSAAEHQLLRARHAQRTPNGLCDNEWCRTRRSAHESEAAGLRRDLHKARERALQLQRDLTQTSEQVRDLETRLAREAREARKAREAMEVRGEETGGCARLATCAALQERAAHLERSLSAETRVKLDLLSALGDAKRHMRVQEGLISRQEKEIEELKAQMLAVMPTEFVTPVSGAVSVSVSKLRLSDGSPLDPNASIYTPKQLCSDA